MMDGHLASSAKQATSEESMIMSAGAAGTAGTGNCQDIEQAGILSAQEMNVVKSFHIVVKSQPPHELCRSGQDHIEATMSELAERSNLAWKAVAKRSNLQTSLYYLFFMHVRSTIEMKFASPSEFLEAFDEFQTYNEQTVENLFDFANAVDLISHFIPPKQNKQVYMEVASRLATRFARRFVTGGGQTAETCDRVLIYEKLCGVIKHRRLRKKKDIRSVEQRPKRRKDDSPATTTIVSPTPAPTVTVTSKPAPRADVIAELIRRVLKSGSAHRMEQDTISQKMDDSHRLKRMKVISKRHQSSRYSAYVYNDSVSDDDDDDFADEKHNYYDNIMQCHAEIPVCTARQAAANDYYARYIGKHAFDPLRIGGPIFFQPPPYNISGSF